MQLRRIAFDRPKVFRITAADLDRFWERLSCDVDHFFDQVTRLNQHALTFDATRKRQHLFYDSRAALCAFFD